MYLQNKHEYRHADHIKPNTIYRPKYLLTETPNNVPPLTNGFDWDFIIIMNTLTFHRHRNHSRRTSRITTKYFDKLILITSISDTNFTPLVRHGNVMPGARWPDYLYIPASHHLIALLHVIRLYAITASFFFLDCLIDRGSSI
jgi:hypothetical protein